MDKAKSASRIRNTFLNTGWGLFVKFSTLAINFFVRTIFIRYLGIEYTGVSSVFTQILTVLSFAELGIGSAITFALYKPIAEKDYKQIARLMHLYKVAYWVIAGVVFAVGMMLVPFIDKLVNNVPTIAEDIRVIYVLYVINSAVSYLLTYRITLFTADQKEFVVSIIHFVSTVLRTIIQTIAIIVYRSFLAYLLIQVAFTILQNIIGTLLATHSFREIGKYPKERLSKNESKNIFRDVKALTIYKLCGIVLNGTDNILISIYLSTATVGYVSNYTLIISEIYYIILQFLNSVTASIGNMVATEGENRQYDMFRVINFSCEFLFCIFTVCLFNLSDEFISDIWLGNEYIIAPRMTLLLLCVDFFLKGTTTVIGTYRNANGLFSQGQYRPFVMAILNIVLSIIFVKMIGLPGIFLGTIVSRLMTQTWFDPLVIFRHAFRINPIGYYAEFFTWCITLGACMFVTRGINSLITIPNAILAFFVHAFICVVFTATISFAVFCKSNNMKETGKYVAGMIRRLIKKPK